MLCFLIVLLVSVCSSAAAPEPVGPHIEWWLRPHEYYEDIYKRVAGVTNFSCPDVQDVNEAQVTAHSLSPKRVRVIAALGDSLTVGSRAGVFKYQEGGENRGVAFPIGGDHDLSSMATLPNFFRMFSPELKGASRTNEQPKDHLNVAISGRTALDLSAQAKELLNRLENMSGIDIKNDWKIVSIFIGTNDLCRHCWNKSLNAATYAKGVTETIDYLKDNLPNTVVNVIPAYNVGKYQQATEYSVECQNYHQNHSCRCINEVSVEEYQKLTDQFNSVYKYFLTNDSYQTDSFAVVVSDALNTLDLFSFIDRKKLILLAPDCFHFSTVGHDVAAKLIWNNLLEPKNNSGANSMTVDPLQPIAIKCPDVNCPFIRTVKNSEQCLPHKKLDLIPPSASIPTMDSGTPESTYRPSIPTFPIVVVASVIVTTLALTVLSRRFLKRKKQKPAEHAPLMERFGTSLSRCKEA